MINELFPKILSSWCCKNKNCICGLGLRPFAKSKLMNASIFISEVLVVRIANGLCSLDLGTDIGIGCFPNFSCATPWAKEGWSNQLHLQLQNCQFGCMPYLKIHVDMAVLLEEGQFLFSLICWDCHLTDSLMMSRRKQMISWQWRSSSLVALIWMLVRLLNFDCC